jgi:CRP-like cAMP-binding protein
MTRMPDLRPIDCTACPIRHRAVCARCDAAELDQLAAIKTYRSFPAGAQIMQRGAALEFVASVVTGVVSLSKTLENGYKERFNGILRQELLNTEWFHSVKQAQVAINIWLKEYNHIRPHHALGMRPPVPETLLEKREIYGTEIGG